MVWNMESAEDRYAQVALQWARQQRAYGRSVRIFHQAHRRWGRALRRTEASAADPLPCREYRAERAGEARPLLRFVAHDAASSGTGKRPLTRRQFEVAGLIAQGMTNEQIARRLVITTGTAGNHVEHILKRLGVNNRAAVAAWFMRMQDKDDESRPDAVPPERIARATAGE